MKCPACSAINPDNATYCKNCGKALRANLRTCPNGHDYDASLPFCPHCPPQRTQSPSSAPTLGGDAIDDKTRLDSADPLLTPGFGGSIPPSANDKTVILGAGSGMSEESGDAFPGDAGQRPLGLRKLTGWLVTFDLDPMGQDFRLFQGRHVIGSSPNCTIRLTVPGVSSEHAILLCRNEKFIIEDNLSSNGTFVNGEMIEDKVYLGENDIIRIATIELKLKSV